MIRFVTIAVFMIYCIIGSSLASPGVTRERVRRIVNGEITSIAYYPFVVQLFEKGEYICGGCIVSEEWILTNAHCVERGTVEDYTILAGSSRITKPPKYKVAEIIIYEAYDPSKFMHDIALLKVSSKLKLNTFIEPVKLANGSEVEPYSTVRVAGHGQTEDEEVSERLREISMTLLSTKRCKKVLENMDDSYLCLRFRESVKGFCFGDFGGPIVTEDKTLVGVMFAVVGECGGRETPSLGVNVSYYRTWIQENTGV